MHWHLIGGHVEEGESPGEALLREVREEIDYDLKFTNILRSIVLDYIKESSSDNLYNKGKYSRSKKITGSSK
ncbi:MAG TPA: NUDIX hydrolase [Bacteroidales bacterium]|nr:NUDIX hydrolase [Bacteroidales bacterium]